MGPSSPALLEVLMWRIVGSPCLFLETLILPRVGLELRQAALPFRSVYVADRWVRAWPSYGTMCSPSPFGKPSGNT